MQRTAMQEALARRRGRNLQEHVHAMRPVDPQTVQENKKDGEEAPAGSSPKGMLGTGPVEPDDGVAVIPMGQQPGIPTDVSQVQQALMQQGKSHGLRGRAMAQAIDKGTK